jgi:hypothetical protein
MNNGIVRDILALTLIGAIVVVGDRILRTLTLNR